MSDEEAPAVSRWAVSHARELASGGPDVPRGKVEVELMTDPWSVWCWGLEPVRRALELRYPSVTFQAHVGGMFATLPDPENMGFDLGRFFATVQRTSGMPIHRGAAVADRPRSTYPACIFVHAVRLLAPDSERLFLRLLREAAYLDGRNVSKEAVAIECAQLAGLAGSEFVDALASGEPEREFRQTLASLEAEGLHAYPTFTVKSHHRAGRVEGFQSLPSLLSIVETISGDPVVAGGEVTPLDVIGPGERVATREVAEACALSMEAAVDALAPHVADGTLERSRLPTGDVWRRL